MAVITPYWGLDGILIFASLLTVAYLYMTRKFKYWAKRGIMELPPTPFTGNFTDCLMLKKSPPDFVWDLYKQSNGLRYMGFYIFDKPFLLVRDPELVKHVLVKDFNVFNDRYASPDVTDRLGYANVFQMKNPGWKILRAKLTPIFTSGKLKRMFELMRMVADDLDEHLEALNLTTTKEVEMKNLCANFTTDMVASTAFGLQANSLKDPKAAFREAGREIFKNDFVRGMEFLIIFFMPHLTKYTGAKFFGTKTSKFFRTVFWDTINHRIASGAKRGDLIDLLIELKQKHEDEGDLGGFSFSGDDLVAQAAVFFSGGFETSSTTMSFTLYELALNMDIQTKLRKEILDALEKTDGKITYDMLLTLPYLDMVVSETLRKYPPLGFLDRITNARYEVPDSDLVLEKGTPIYISMIGMHYDPEYFPDPQKYDPERFTDENKRKRPNFVYFPFGEGPHICIGMRLGLLQSKLGIIQVIRKYEVSPSEKTSNRIVFDPKGLTTTALGGLYLNVRKITSEADNFKMAVITPYWGLDGVIILTSLMAAAYLYMTRKFKYWAKRGIMEVPPTPFIGNFTECLMMKKSPADFVWDLYNRSKGLPYMGFYIFDKPFFLPKDPELIKHILVKDFDVFCDRHATADVNDRLGYANVFQMKNPAWKTLRAKLSPIFTSGKLKKMFELMRMVADDLDEHLETLNLNVPKEVELKDVCSRFTTDMIGSTAFGLRVNSLKDPNAPFRVAGKEIFATNFFRSMEFLIIFFAPQLTKYTHPKVFGKKSGEFLRNVFWRMINERIDTGEKRNDLIELLIDLKKKHEGDDDLGGFRFNGDDLVAQAAVFFTAGFETSSTTMSFTLYELALNMDIQRKLRKEVLDALEESGGKITYDMIMTLPYLDMVVSETLRKYPPLAFLDRVCNTNYKVPNSDLTLEKGTPVFISIFGLHYDPKYFPDPQTYDPERFNEANKQQRPSCVYIPFGDGPHICIGLRMGLMQSKLGIVQFLRKYEVTPSEKTQIPMVFDPKGVVTSAIGGLYLNVRKVTSEAG
ncbi:uncharacterized protein LOC128877154 [Hylaeus volcanicus]|uniref:uncharacterized protein LOC128877154 n=1 Tax=Hylaeus volcanicus TaxID=313075 RepID=UPI0023B7CEB1|nr:uncharacterized protein LOC128877154 [Hylaeus volcanicus]